MKLLFMAFMALFIVLQTAHATSDDTVSTDVTREDVLKAQEKWAAGIVGIGKVYTEEGDYKQSATDLINALYAYDISAVLFKPTLASADQFRETFDEALSYFVGGIIEEDKGFAIKPWTNVRFGAQQIITYPTAAKASGVYFFTPADSEEEVEVEFSFGYMKDTDGHLRINLHHSSLPYQP